MNGYPPLRLSVRTPVLALRSASDSLLEELAPLVHAGQAGAEPPPYDDPISLYEEDPDLRVARWLEGIWRARGSMSTERRRLCLVVLVDGRPVGVQDLVAEDFAAFGSVSTFSWLASDLRGRGLGREMRAAVLHLAFNGLEAGEARSDAFVDNVGSNAVSRSLGYTPNGLDWATRRGEPGQLQRWRITADQWRPTRRADIDLDGAQACLTSPAWTRRPAPSPDGGTTRLTTSPTEPPE